MTLSKEQIEQLFAFTEKKFVRHYDLQVELVDHLAERIEEEMKANQNLTFDSALQRVYASFGLFGFAHVVQEKQNALYKRSWRLWFNELKQYFTLPKLILTIVIFLLAYSIGQFLNPVEKSVLIIVTIIGFASYQFYHLINFKKASSKNILLLEYSPLSTIVTPILIYEYIIFFKEQIESNLLFAILVVTGFLIFNAIVQVSKQVHREAERLYPEAFVKTA